MKIKCLVFIYQTIRNVCNCNINIFVCIQYQGNSVYIYFIYILKQKPHAHYTERIILINWQTLKSKPIYSVSNIARLMAYNINISYSNILIRIYNYTLDSYVRAAGDILPTQIITHEK